MLKHVSGRYIVVTVDDPGYDWFSYRDSSYDLSFPTKLYDSKY